MTLVAVVVTFVLMEPVTYAAHRWVMHGMGWVLHRSHHQKLASRFEANDLFPVTFSGVAMILFAIATHWAPLWPVCWGITAYGVAYLFVHDGYIHARVKLPRKALRFLQPLRDAHRIHHLFGGEPYGMLAPRVPADLRERAARTTRDPLPSQRLPQSIVAASSGAEGPSGPNDAATKERERHSERKDGILGS